MIVEPGKTYIGKVRATSSERDTLALQIRLGSTLSATNLHPPGLPASAILCIRKFRDPLPGSLHLQRTGMRPPHAWEQAVLASLKQLVEHAAHPARHAVPSNAEAIIFADRAEMLACLASDWCEGNTLTRWWWHNLFRGKDIGQLLVSTWLETPEYIPAALHHLATSGKAVSFVQALHDNDIHPMLQSIVHSFGLHELHSALETVSKAPPSAEPALSQTPGEFQESATSMPTALLQNEPQETFTRAQFNNRPRSTNSTWPAQQSQPVHHTHQTSSSPLPVAPWQPWAPEITSSKLRPEQALLLGIGLMIVRVPAIVRTPSFAHAVLQWQSTEQRSSSRHPRTAGKSTGIGDKQQPPVQPRKAVPAGEDEQARKGTLALVLGPDISHKVSPSPEIPEACVPTEARNGQGREVAVSANTSREGSPSPEIPEPSLLLEVEDRQNGEGTFAVALANDAEPQKPAIIEPLEAEIETQLGGLFYLINLGLFLNLYGDFTTPLQPGISLSIWDFITLLGQLLLDDQMPADPAWSFLAQMAGRSEQEPPGKDFEPPDSWHIPAEWLKPFQGEGPWQWTVNDGRLQVQHPAQFLLLDLPLDAGDPEQQLVREMQAYDKVFFEGFMPGASPMPAASLPPLLERWLRWLMPYVRLRLQRALGLPSTDNLAHILCQHHAHISVTATHLNIVFSLAELPIEIRLSGLDRNPGWVPAAGRFIAFHFE